METSTQTTKEQLHAIYHPHGSTSVDEPTVLEQWSDENMRNMLSLDYQAFTTAMNRRKWSLRGITHETLDHLEEPRLHIVHAMLHRTIRKFHPSIAINPVPTLELQDLSIDEFYKWNRFQERIVRQFTKIAHAEKRVAFVNAETDLLLAIALRDYGYSRIHGTDYFFKFPTSITSVL